MSGNSPALLTACKPRWDVLREDKGVSAFAVDLDLISGALAEKSMYGDAKSFFSITYPTTALRTVPRQVFGRITGKSPHGKGIFLLGTALGGGKSHVLAALYHMAHLGGRKLPEEAQELLDSVELPPIRAVILTQSSPAGGRQAPKTMWGEIAKQLGRPELMKDFDERMQAPSKESLRQLLQGGPVLILVDELTNYMIRASAVPVGQSSLAIQTRVFLQVLEEVVDQLTNTALVVSQLPEEFEPEHRAAIEKVARGRKAERAELEEQIKKEVSLAAQYLLRKAEPVTPVRDDEELLNILRRRVFESVDGRAAADTAAAYAAYYASPGVRAALPVSTHSKDYEQKLLRTYPFHPKLISLLRDKLGQAPKFMQTRGALLLTILAVRRLYKEKCGEAMVHPFHVDPRDGEIREELSKRVFDEVKLDNAMVTEFVDGPDGRARAGIIDDTFGGSLGTRLASCILLESALITHRGPGDPLVGAAQAEILLDALVPGDDEVRASQALQDGILETSYHIEKFQDKLVFRGEVNLNRYIDEKAQHVPDHEVERAVRIRMEKQVLKGSSVFDRVWWPTSPEEVDDKPKLRLVVLPPTDPWWHSSEEPKPEVKRLFDKKNQAGEPRRNKNTLVFLVPLLSERDKLFRAIRRTIAIETVRKDASVMTSLTEEQTKKLEEDRAKAEAMAILRTGMAYRLLFYPVAEGQYGKPALAAKSISLAERDLGIDQESMKLGESRVLGVISQRLRDEGKLREETPVSPDWIRARVFREESEHARQSLKFSEIESSFYEDTSLPFLYPRDLIRRSIEDGMREGSFVVLSGKRLFTAQLLNRTGERPSMHEDIEVVLDGSDRHRELLEQYHEECGFPLEECKCKVAPPPVPEICPRCHQPIDKCVCRIVLRDILLKDVPGTLAEALRKRNAKAKEMFLEVSKPGDVGLILKVVPAFGGARARADLVELSISAELRNDKGTDTAKIEGKPPGVFWPMMKSAAESVLAQITSGKATGNARVELRISLKEPAEAGQIGEILRPLTMPGSEILKVNLKVIPEARA